MKRHMLSVLGIPILKAQPNFALGFASMVVQGMVLTVVFAGSRFDGLYGQVNMIRKNCVCLFGLLAASLCLSIPASAQEIWMSAGHHINHPAPGWEGVRRDSGDMWKPGAPWATVASDVKVMGLVSPNLERVTDSDLKIML